MTGNTNSLSATPSQFPTQSSRGKSFVGRRLTRLNAAGRRRDTVLCFADRVDSCRGTTRRIRNRIAPSNANYNWDGGARRGKPATPQYAANPWGIFSDARERLGVTGDTGPDEIGPSSGSYRVVTGSTTGNRASATATLASASPSKPNSDEIRREPRS